jgi:beta-lactamase superfamily II metal-dependent hydrolase
MASMKTRKPATSAVRKTAASTKRAAKKTVAKPRPTVASSSSTEETGLRVRMYRVGFGDCFLVSVPSGSGQEHILIDCGVFKGTSGKGDLGTIEGAVENLVQETGGKLALVVMTHRHADHIIGFSRCKEQFQKISVESVWMPVWEKEYETASTTTKAKRTKAADFQDNLTDLASRMRANLAAAPAAAQDDVHEQTMRLVLNATGPLAAAGGGTNAASLALLKTGFGATPEYYAAGDVPTVPTSLAKAGLTAQILGPPPVDDIAFLKLMDLTKGVGQYLGDEVEDDGEPFAPFDPACEVSVDDYPALSFVEWYGREMQKPPADRARGAASRLQQAVKDSQPASLLEAAKTLDSFLNNQSLVILFTFQGKKLLFVGDAQAGNWEHWLFNDGAPDKSGTASLSAEGQSILGSIDFYKVGHHGSTNATPKAALAAMRSNIVAMCSTEPGVYGTVSKGTEVPRGPLLDALEQKLTVLRSDEIEAHRDGAVVPPSHDEHDDVAMQPKSGRIVVGDGWVDYLF